MTISQQWIHPNVFYHGAGFRSKACGSIFRRIATRYDKLKDLFLARIHLVVGFIRLKRKSVREFAFFSGNRSAAG
jgi:hypothetical protein